jgi:predicted transposase YbfD/YdcC
MSAKNNQPRPPKSLIECFEEIEDPRIDRTREHKLIDILVIGLCTMLTVGENFTDMEDFGKAKLDWLKTFLELPNGIPSHDTFNRVFSAIDPQHFLDCFIAWIKEICPSLGPEGVAIDGKALRRAHNEGQTIPYIVSAWARKTGWRWGRSRWMRNPMRSPPSPNCCASGTKAALSIDAMGCQKRMRANRRGGGPLRSGAQGQPLHRKRGVP